MKNKITLDDWIIFIRFLIVLAVFILLLLLFTKEEVPEEETTSITFYPITEQMAEPRIENIAGATIYELEVVTPVAEDPVPYVIEVTDDDIELMARVVMSEASVLSMECKQAIASTIVNRVKSKRFPNTVEGVVHQKNQYSMQNNGKPNADCYAAVQQALRYEEYPSDMYYFRMWHYHKFGTPLMEIDDCYFSTQ